MSENVTWLERLETRFSRQWLGLHAARQTSVSRRNELEALFPDRKSPDSSLVVFGSLARQEVTGGSDLDWLLLVDGQSIPEHKEDETEIAKILEDSKFIKPGRSGLFGSIVGSHDLIHNIGGEDDTNSNTTRRVLLLLEALAIGNGAALGRVRKQILRRYLEDDRGLRHAGGDVRIPRFLLNDLTRYWRTVTVDFVYKQRLNRDGKWALRNAKLRMSRKLLYATGLLHCFFCHLDPDSKAVEARASLRLDTPEISPLVSWLEAQLELPPLDVLAKACLLFNAEPNTVNKIFDNYERFLGLLNDQDKRKELETTSDPDAVRSSPAWAEVRSISGPFHEALVSLFLKENPDLATITMKYGIF